MLFINDIVIDIIYVFKEKCLCELLEFLNCINEVWNVKGNYFKSLLGFCVIYVNC